MVRLDNGPEFTGEAMESRCLANNAVTTDDLRDPRWGVGSRDR
jgi:hypothetical protein